MRVCANLDGSTGLLALKFNEMLVNLTPIQSEIDRCKAIAKEHGFNYTPASESMLMDGVYVALNFPALEFEELGGRLTFEQEYELYLDYQKSQYGVADDLDQILEYYKHEIESEDRFFIYVCPIHQDKANKGKGGEWRWHKWGPYIGNLNPQFEYLDDEEFDVGYVLIFHIVKI